jgi:hypothetical protein
MFIKLAKHRSYEYTPRFYDPDKEKRKHPGIKIRSQRHRTRGRSLIWMIAVLGFILYLMYFLLKLSQ